VISLTAANNSSTPNRIVSHLLLAALLSSAPARPPAALVMPKLQSTRRSTPPCISAKRSDVPIRCGIETAATASLVSTCSASTGVSRLPMPNPVTAAIAPASSPETTRTKSKSS